MIAAGPKTPSVLETDIEKFRNALVYSQPDIVRFYGHKLYRQLLQPIFTEIDGKKFYIVPDGRLAFLPFEVLLDREVDPPSNHWDLPYLIRSHSIAYGYAASLPQNLARKQKDPNMPMAVAFAPVQLTDWHQPATTGSPQIRAPSQAPPTKTLALPYSAQEVAAIASLFQQRQSPFRSYIHAAANEAAFKKSLKSAGLIHMATHGVINGQQPELSYLMLASGAESNEDGVFYLGELYASETTADLIVLAACDTGLGTIEPGEGVLGFCRVFSTPAPNSVIVSLWQVSDDSTADLMTTFYDRLLSGRHTTSALHEAKLHQIAKNKPPYTWAPFILVNDNVPSPPLFPK